jgi:hypothetical protein
MIKWLLCIQFSYQLAFKIKSLFFTKKEIKKLLALFLLKIKNRSVENNFNYFVFNAPNFNFSAFLFYLLEFAFTKLHKSRQAIQGFFLSKYRHYFVHTRASHFTRKSQSKNRQHLSFIFFNQRFYRRF